MKAIATRAEIEDFLHHTVFSGYQSVPLPYGLRVPGKDKRRATDFYLSDRVKGRSIIDVGTYYGLYPCEAILRGARKAVGLEFDPERYKIASRISRLHGSAYEIVNSRIEDYASSEKFDIVLFLNVLHHVLDPVEAVRRATQLCRETLIIEFCLPWDIHYIKFLSRKYQSSPLGSWRVRFRSLLIRLASKGVPIFAIGNREYHRTFYFSPEAFRNLFVLHHKFFSAIEFHPSPSNPFRAVAECRVP